jgi:hypothetical protein
MIQIPRMKSGGVGGSNEFDSLLSTQAPAITANVHEQLLRCVSCLDRSLTCYYDQKREHGMHEAATASTPERPCQRRRERLSPAVDVGRASQVPRSQIRRFESAQCE